MKIKLITLLLFSLLAGSAKAQQGPCDPQVTRGWQLETQYVYPNLTCGYYTIGGVQYPYLGCYVPYMNFNPSDTSWVLQAKTCYKNGTQQSSCNFNITTAQKDTCTGTLNQGQCVNGNWVENVDISADTKWKDGNGNIHHVVFDHMMIPVQTSGTEATVTLDGTEICY